MESRPEAVLASLAATQHGAFSRRQANDVGIDDASLGRRVRTGTYRRFATGVYVVNAAPRTWRQEVSCAVLSSGEGAAASHQTAAYLHAMTTRRGPAVEVVVRRWNREHRDHTVHESKDLAEGHVTVVDGIRTTDAVRTVVDLGASAPNWLVESCLDEGLRRELFTLEEVAAFLRRVAKRGRRGVGVIRPLLAERAWIGIRTESPLEDAFLEMMANGALPLPVAQFELRHKGRLVSRADFAYPERKILIELDGAHWHVDKASFQADRAKQNRAVTLGWTVLRYTWQDVRRNGHVIVDQLRTLLA